MGNRTGGSPCLGSERRPKGKTLQKRKPKGDRCYSGGGLDRHAKECSLPPRPEKCHCCQSITHMVATCPHRTGCSRPPVLREDRKQSPSHALRRSLERWGRGGVRLSVTTVFSGGEVQGLRVARHVTCRSFLHKVICSTRRSKQNGAFRSKTEKDMTLFLNVSFSLPGWEVYLMQIQGNSISQTAADLGFLTTVEEL